MIKYVIDIPKDFEDYEWEIESKGFISIDVKFDDKIFNINFYDEVRLNQTIVDDLGSNGFFFEKNLVVISKVNLKEIKVFLDSIEGTRYINYLK